MPAELSGPRFGDDGSTSLTMTWSSPKARTSLRPAESCAALTAAEPIAVRSKILVEVAAVEIDDDVRRRQGSALNRGERALRLRSVRVARIARVHSLAIDRIHVRRHLLERGTLSSGATITVPPSCVASIRAIEPLHRDDRRVLGAVAPETNATDGPGLHPRMTATGIRSAESEPAGNGDLAVRRLCPAPAVADRP